MAIVRTHPLRCLTPFYNLLKAQLHTLSIHIIESKSHSPTKRFQAHLILHACIAYKSPIPPRTVLPFYPLVIGMHVGVILHRLFELERNLEGRESLVLNRSKGGDSGRYGRPGRERRSGAGSVVVGQRDKGDIGVRGCSMGDRKVGAVESKDFRNPTPFTLSLTRLRLSLLLPSILHLHALILNILPQPRPSSIFSR